MCDGFAQQEEERVDAHEVWGGQSVGAGRFEAVEVVCVGLFARWMVA